MSPVLTEVEVEALYVCWLKGESLRTLARSLGSTVSHNVIANRFIKRYGKDACNLTTTSLARTLLADYPEDPEVLKTALGLIGKPETQKHRSGHSIQQLTNYQTPTKADILDTIAVSSLDAWDYVENEGIIWGFLRLPYAVLVYEVTFRVLDGLTRCVIVDLTERKEAA